MASEIMHAMWKPDKYKYVYFVNCISVLSITMPHCIALYWAYGDVLLTHSNALSFLSSSTPRTIALVFMIIHQCHDVEQWPLLLPKNRYWNHVVFQQDIQAALLLEGQFSKPGSMVDMYTI